MSQLRTLEEGVGNGSLIVLQERGVPVGTFQFLCLCVRISHKQSLMDLRGVSVDFSPSKDYADLQSARSIKANSAHLSLLVIVLFPLVDPAGQMFSQLPHEKV